MWRVSQGADRKRKLRCIHLNAKDTSRHILLIGPELRARREGAAMMRGYVLLRT
jgi:hypothetical protein